MNEIWKAIPGFNSIYEISNLGRVRSIDHMRRNSRGGGYSMARGRVLRPGRNKANGCWYVNLCHGSKGRGRTIHRLVAQAFIPNPEQLPVVDHIDGNKDNNVVSNLEWVTPTENNVRAIANGLRVPCNYRGAQTVLSATLVNAMRRLATKVDADDLAWAFNLPLPIVKRCVKRVASRRIGQH